MQVLEETGCDVSKLLKLEDYIEVSMWQQRVRLYIITGVKGDTVFAPQTKKEISVSKCSVLLSYFFLLNYIQNILDSLSENEKGNCVTWLQNDTIWLWLFD